MKSLLISLVMLPYALFAAPLYLSSDWSSYNSGKDSLVYVELYYSFNRAGLNFIEDSTGNHIAYLKLHFGLYDSLKETIIDTFNQKLAVPLAHDALASENYLLYDYLSLLLKPGAYAYKLELVPTKSPGEYNEGFIKVRAYPEDEISMSDITLISNMTNDTTPGPFRRFGKRILPSTSGYFGGGDQALYFYFEAYNVNLEDSVNFLLSVLDTSGKTLKNFTLENPIQSKNKLVYINGLSVAGLPDGVYILRVIYDKKGQKYGKEKIFRVRHPARKVSSIENSPLTSAQLAWERLKLIYFATPEELKRYDKLNPSGKVAFLRSFWKKLAGDSLAGDGEKLRQLIDARWKYASLHFSTSGADNTNGWKTDRGRIYILYGTPDNIERHRISMVGNEWERWNYSNIKGGSYFIFADIYGLGEPRLVDSDVPGELNNPDWLKKLQGQGGVFKKREQGR